jgi:hypothetical protein
VSVYPGNIFTNPELTGNSGVPGTPPAGLGMLYGIGTANLKPGWINEAGGAQQISTDVNTNNKYKFSVYLATAQNTIAGSTRILFDTREFDTGSNVDVVTTKGRFTAPVAGFYQFNVGANANTSATFLTIQLMKNGSVFKVGESSTNNNPNLNSAFGPIQLAVNDTIDINLNAGAAVAIGTGASTTFFGGYLISTT